MSSLRYCMSSVYIQTPESFHVKPEQKALSTMCVINLMLFPILSKSAHQILAGLNSFTLVPFLQLFQITF